MHHATMDTMEETVYGERSAIRRGVRVNDTVIVGNWLFVVTQEALDCDCGKGMYCPYVKQERV